MVICLQEGADLHMAQLLSLPLTVSCFSEIQIGFTFLVPAHLGSPGKKAVKRMCVCVFPLNNQNSSKFYRPHLFNLAIAIHVEKPLKNPIKPITQQNAPE